MMQFFSAKRQKGAFLNGHRIKTSKITGINNLFIDIILIYCRHILIGIILYKIT